MNIVFKRIWKFFLVFFSLLSKCISFICKGKLRKCLVTLIALVALENECLSLIAASHSWNLMPGPSDDTVRVLFVADPQMLSPFSEPYYPLSLVAIWDANRFIRRGFATAVWASEPEVVVFLGDLLNDGSVVEDEDFDVMAEYFHASFRLPPSVKEVVYIAGDNDVGGEGLDLLTEHKMKRFRKHFPNTPTKQHKFVTFVSMESDRPTRPRSPDRRDDSIRVLLSHQPILSNTFIAKTLEEERPSLIVSGHYHEALHLTGQRANVRSLALSSMPPNNSLHTFQLSMDTLTEVIVPTCSYRMGRPAYGYGLANIAKTGILQYSVLWLPSRFRQLKLYLLTLCFVVLLLVVPGLLRASLLLLRCFGNSLQEICSKPRKNNNIL